MQKEKAIRTSVAKIVSQHGKSSEKAPFRGLRNLPPEKPETTEKLAKEEGLLK